MWNSIEGCHGYPYSSASSSALRSIAPCGALKLRSPRPVIPASFFICRSEGTNTESEGEISEQQKEAEEGMNLLRVAGFLVGP